jgi:hypothetical protein
MPPNPAINKVANSIVKGLLENEKTTLIFFRVTGKKMFCGLFFGVLLDILLYHTQFLNQNQRLIVCVIKSKFSHMS